MNKRCTSLSLTAALVAGGAAGLALGITRIAGASTQEPAASAPVGTASSAAAAPTTAAAPTSTVAELETSEVETSEVETSDVESSEVETSDDDTTDGDRHGDGDGDHGGPGGEVDAAATALGITPDEMFTALDSGQTIAALAQAKGIDPQTVIDAVVAAVTAREQAEVAAGDHTQAEVDAKLADIATQVAAMVNGTLGADDGPRSHGPKSHGDDQDGDHEDGDHEDGDHEDGDSDG